jgi:hypothetical protein
MTAQVAARLMGFPLLRCDACGWGCFGEHSGRVCCACPCSNMPVLCAVHVVLVHAVLVIGSDDCGCQCGLCVWHARVYGTYVYVGPFECTLRSLERVDNEIHMYNESSRDPVYHVYNASSRDPAYHMYNTSSHMYNASSRDPSYLTPPWHPKAGKIVDKSLHIYNANSRDPAYLAQAWPSVVVLGVQKGVTVASVQARRGRKRISLMRWGVCKSCIRGFSGMTRNVRRGRERRIFQLRRLCTRFSVAGSTRKAATLRARPSTLVSESLHECMFQWQRAWVSLGLSLCLQDR